MKKNPQRNENGSQWFHIETAETDSIVRGERAGKITKPFEIVEGVHFGENGENYALLYKRVNQAEYEMINGEYMSLTLDILKLNAKYIVSSDSIMYYSRGDERLYEERLEKFVLCVTPTDGEEIQTKEIDMLKAFEELPYLPRNIGRVVKRNGKHYIQFAVVYRLDDEIGFVLFDLEEETVIEDRTMLFYDSVKAIYISEISKYSRAFIDTHTGNSVFSYSPVEDLLQSMLVKEYPEIIELIERNEGEYTGIDLYFEKVEDPDEIMRLFEKEGVDPFENAELSEKDSKDGKRHKINSFEDFLKWYDFSEREKEEVEMLLGKESEE